MSTAAAPPITHTHDPELDERVRAIRARDSHPHLERLRQRIHGIVGTIVGGGIVAVALALHAGPAFDPVTFAILVALFAALVTVQFEIASGFSPPTELVLVPMLFALPLGFVPAAVAAGFTLSSARRLVERRDLKQVLPQLGNAAHVFGPVFVLWAAGGLPLRWSAWPVYLAALAAQFVVDFGVCALCELGEGTSLRELASFAGIAYTLDAVLAPIGLAFAFATRTHPALVALVLPLVLLLRHFSQERKRRIDHALELSDAYRGTAFLLGDVVEADDAYTGTHSRHVVDLVLGVCDELGLGAAERRDAEFVALLHDVGKIRIPGAIINKPGPLDAEERAIIETHTIEGERLLEQVGGLLGHIGRVVRSCHEHWDGRGYPDALAGEAIPRVARIVCACDAYSAITTDRPYRGARTAAEAIAEMQRCAGTQFDPQVVTALTRVAERIG